MWGLMVRACIKIAVLVARQIKCVDSSFWWDEISAHSWAKILTIISGGLELLKELRVAWFLVLKFAGQKLLTNFTQSDVCPSFPQNAFDIWRRNKVRWRAESCKGHKKLSSGWEKCWQTSWEEIGRGGTRFLQKGVAGLVIEENDKRFRRKRY